MTVRAEPNAVEEHAPGGLRTAPVTRSGLLVWVGAYAVLTVVAIIVGWLIVDHLGGVRRFDDHVSRDLGDIRTDTWNSLTWFGSGIAEAVVKIPATIVLSAFFVWRWRRWREVALLVGALLLEVAVFVTASFIVDRARPPISQLDSIPPTSAYPSGHTAAAVAFYGAIAIIVFWHTRNRVARTVSLMAVVVLPPVVGFSRTYRGMHHLSDVIVGGLLGIVSLAVTYRVVTTGPDPGGASSRADRATDEVVARAPERRPR
jgi:membrane-associated phospholipid phosphatase